jgi:two-component system sensor histidine kinase UhpB
VGLGASIRSSWPKGGWFAAAIALLAAQLIFWLGLAWFETASRPPEISQAPAVPLVLSDAEGQFASDAQVVRATEIPAPAYAYIDPERRPKGKFQVRFDHPADAGPYALYLNFSNTLGDIRLNGNLLNARLDYNRWMALEGFGPTVYLLPDEWIRNGENLLELETLAQGRKTMPPFAVGPAEHLESAYKWGAFVSSEMPLAAIAVMAFVILLLLVVRWPAEDRAWTLALIGLLVGWSLYNAHSLGALDSIEPDWAPGRHALRWTIFYTFVFGFVAFVLAWTRAPRWTFKVALIGFGVALFIAVGAQVFDETIIAGGGRRLSQEIRKGLEHTLTIGLGLGMMGMLLADVARRKPRRIAETVLFLISITSLIVDALDDRFDIHVPFQPDLALTFYIAPACGLFMAVGLCLVLARHVSEARRVVVSQNETLSLRLAEREAEIAESYQKQQSLMRRQAVLDERQRIVRDMHDGIGSQLVGLMLQIKNDRIDSQGVQRSLDSSVTDLRLIVDSLDSAGDSLDAALGTFRHRVKPQVEAAGLQFDWINTMRDEAPPYSAHVILQVFRILQEAIANALRHAKAGRISVRITETRDAAFPLLIEVADDGQGGAALATGGRGLSNMNMRAEAMGSRLSIASGAAGTTVALRLPPAISPSGG